MRNSLAFAYPAFTTVESALNVSTPESVFISTNASPQVPAVVNPTANFTAPADRNPREAGSNNDEDRSNKGPHGRDSDNSGAYDAHADQRQLPLPLGRDEPLKIIPAGTILEALVRFPCSLTEEDRYNRDTQSSKLRGESE